MKKLLLLLILTLTSCSSYQVNDNRIASILAVTEKGDTISVPYKQFLTDRYTNYTRFNYNNNWYYNNWRYDYNWRWNYYYSQLDYYNNWYNDRYNRFPENGGLNYNNNNNSLTGTQTNVNSKRGEKVTSIPPENDGIYVPPTLPKPPKDKKDNMRIWSSPRPAPGNTVRRSFNQPSFRQNNFTSPSRSYSAPRSSAPTRSAPAVQSRPSGGKGSSTGKIN